MQPPKTYTFTQSTHDKTFKKGDVAIVDTAPRASYHKRFVLIALKEGLKAFRYRELIQNKVLLIPANLRGRKIIADKSKLKILGVLTKKS